MEKVRLQVYIAHSGLTSRRAAETLIAEGRVRVNGAVVATQGEKVGDGDEVSVDGIVIKPEVERHYLVMNKPPLYICTEEDREGRRLASSLLPPGLGARLYTIGRLDYESEGLLLWTNDGDFAAKVSHPSANIEKEYLVEAQAPIPDEVAERFTEGLPIEDVVYKAYGIERVDAKTILITLVEGKNREIRRVFSHFHLHPRVLRRVRIGSILLQDLPLSATRRLSPAEHQSLCGADCRVV
jgi:23S rRNA pseudouridine2605 synthase